MEQGLAGELVEGGHRLDVRVYFEDTDFSGLVYHARYLHFFERGRTDYLRLLGVGHRELLAGEFGEPCFFAVRRMTIDFRSAAGIDDVLTVTTRPRPIKGIRITLDQRIEKAGALVAEAVVEVVVLSKAGRPMRLAEAVASRFG